MFSDALSTIEGVVELCILAATCQVPLNSRSQDFGHRPSDPFSENGRGSYVYYVLLTWIVLSSVPQAVGQVFLETLGADRERATPNSYDLPGFH